MNIKSKLLYITMFITAIIGTYIGNIGVGRIEALTEVFSNMTFQHLITTPVFKTNILPL